MLVAIVMFSCVEASGLATLFILTTIIITLMYQGVHDIENKVSCNLQPGNTRKIFNVIFVMADTVFGDGSSHQFYNSIVGKV